jgi:large subunit ribosomal protein L24
MPRMGAQGKIKLRKNDTVKVIAGREKGKSGRVVTIDRAKMRAVVEGLNMVKKAVKQKKQNQKAGITSVEAPLPLGKLMIVCKKCGPTRIGYAMEANGKKRVCRKCGGDL